MTYWQASTGDAHIPVSSSHGPPAAAAGQESSRKTIKGRNFSLLVLKQMSLAESPTIVLNGIIL
jgi:hypothetical protein